MQSLKIYGDEVTSVTKPPNIEFVLSIFTSKNKWTHVHVHQHSSVYITSLWWCERQTVIWPRRPVVLSCVFRVDRLVPPRGSVSNVTHWSMSSNVGISILITNESPRSCNATFVCIKTSLSTTSWIICLVYIMLLLAPANRHACTCTQSLRSHV